jgi:2-iminobutanoate/2-iminopropanoate deaminase
MEIRATASAGAPDPIGPYSQALVGGDLVFCSGQLPIDPATGELVTGSIELHAQRVLSNLEAVLVASGSRLDRVLRTTVYLADIADFAAVNRVYQDAFGTHRPARSAVQVAALPRTARLEIDCIAMVDRGAGQRSPAADGSERAQADRRDSGAPGPVP